VPVGRLSPDEIVTPGLFVDYLVQAHTTLADLGSSASVESSGKDTDQPGWLWPGVPWPS